MTFSELIAVYLFLGGTAAGAYAVLASLDVFRALRQGSQRQGHNQVALQRLCESTYERTRRIVYGASLAIIAAGILCLIADLGRPDAFYFLLLYPTGSLISIGALALSLLTVSLVAAFCEATFTLSASARRVMFVVKTLGIPVSVVVMAYTGLLLKSVVAVKLWQTNWLPVLFVLSALSCGCAVVLLGLCSCEDDRATKRWKSALLHADIAFVALEAVAVVALFADLSCIVGFNEVRDVLVGSHASLFWAGFVACALLLPLAIEVPYLVRKQWPSTVLVASVASLVLVGGLCLRLVMVAAGVQPVV